MNFEHSEKTPRHSLGGFSAVVVLHLLVAYAVIAVKMGPHPVEKNHQTELKLVEEKVVPPPPPQQPKISSPKMQAPIIPFVPLPDIQVEQHVEAPAPVITAISREAPTTDVLPIRPAPQGTGDATEWAEAKVDGSMLILDGCEVLMYPWSAQKERQEGAVLLAFLVDPHGRALEAKVAKSSGFPALDEAARTGLQVCKFRPEMVDGKPRQAWKKLRYIWDLPV